MIILAIDPGSEQSGYCIWDGARVLDSGVSNNRPLLCVAEDLARGSRGGGVIPVDLLAIEQIGHYGTGMPAGRQVFDTCIWTGRFMQSWSQYRGEITCRLVLRPTIKTHLCGTPRAKDANVRQAVIDRLGKPGTKKDRGPTYGVTSHAMQALALALYVSDTERIAA